MFWHPLQSSTPVFSSRDTNVRPEIRGDHAGQTIGRGNKNQFNLTAADSGAFAEYPARDVLVEGATAPDAHQEELVQKVLIVEFRRHEVPVWDDESQGLINAEITDARKEALEAVLEVLSAVVLLLEEAAVALERELRSDDDGRREVSEREHLQQVGNLQWTVVGDAEHFRLFDAIRHVECQADQVQDHHAVAHRPANVITFR